MIKGLSGFSYLEVLIATLVVSIALVPMMDALLPGLQGSELHRRHAQVHYTLRGKLETVLAEPFDNLEMAATAAGTHTSPSAYSDTAASVPHEVFIWHYDVDDADLDGNVFTGGEDDLLWVRVAAQNSAEALETLIGR